MEKNRKDVINSGIPDNAVKVREDGEWTVFWSNTEKSFYFTCPACPSSVLKLSREELLALEQKSETPGPSAKNADAKVPAVEEASLSLSQRDKRKFKRFTRRCEATFTFRGVSKKGIACDFSIDGLFIRTVNPFSSDEVIDIMVHLPDDSLSSLKGRVTRSMKNAFGNMAGTLAKAYKNGMGIKIIKKDANYLNFIRSLIK